MPEIHLPGIDGGNMLGFLTALGTLRVLTLNDPDAPVRMRWKEDSCWAPVIEHGRIGSPERLVDVVAHNVCGENTIDSSWRIGEDLTFSCSYFSEQLASAAMKATPERRTTTDFLAALGSDVFGCNPQKDQMSDTEFRTMSGAGHQHFLGFMRELARTTDASHIRRTLLARWDYADCRFSLRWDPADYRPHALRFDDPAQDPIKTMRGANRLAIEALPLWPTVPLRHGVRTLGFEERNGDVEITWPIWTDRLELGTISSLLGLEELQATDVAETSMLLRRRGIAQVFRARRFTDGKYRNFSPARALL
jgi:hypothetical protein